MDDFDQNRSRRVANMDLDNLSDSLEQYSTNRANFGQLSGVERQAVASALRVARSQVKSDSSVDRKNTYTQQLIRKRSAFFHLCGQLDIDKDEARALWWNVVYGSPSPNERSTLV